MSLCLLSGCTGFAQFSASPSEFLLIDDFSNCDAYTKAEVNPYHEQAQEPLWIDSDSRSSLDDSGQIALHTNNLGWYTGAQRSHDSSEHLVMSDGGGFLTLSWQGTRASWYTMLGPVGRGKNLSLFRYLTFRVKGRFGGESVAIQLETPRGNSVALALSNYVTIRSHVEEVLGAGDWQTCVIPLKDFQIGTQNVVAIVFHLDLPRSEHSSETIYLDDLMFVRDIEYRPPIESGTKPVSIGHVKILDGQLIVGGKSFLIRGVGYSPTPIGQTPEFGAYTPFTSESVRRDFALMQSVGINTVRTWGRFDDFRDRDPDGTVRAHSGNRALLDAGAGPYGIYVCAGFWVPYTISFANEWATTRLAEEFRDYVEKYKKGSGILFWAIGNENNLHNGYDWRWYQFANRLAKIAYEVEGPAYHPVAIVAAAGTLLGDPHLGSDEGHLKYVDVIGVNAYLGKNWSAWEAFFEQLRNKTAKPIWITEYGVDAWHTHDRANPVNGHEDQSIQADYDVKEWLEIVRKASRRLIGATVMEYSDEWWKDHIVPSGAYLDHLHRHDYGGWDDSLDEPEALPDQFKNEEWWGLVAVEPAEEQGDVDRVIPRQAFYELYSPTIGGRVLDEQGTPIPNVQVRVFGDDGTLIKETTSDQQGLYSLTRLGNKNYTVTAARPGFAMWSRTASLTKEQPTLIVDILSGNLE